MILVAREAAETPAQEKAALRDAALLLTGYAGAFIWIIWWVGFSFFVAFVGNVWPLVSPWKIIFEWADAVPRRLGAGKGLELLRPYPDSLGVWPAVAVYAAFVWVELVFLGGTVPSNLALLALFYSGVTWAGMILFGKEVWLRRGEAFSVFFGLLGRFAPTEVRVTDPTLCEDCGSDCRIGEGECVDCHAPSAYEPVWTG